LGAARADCQACRARGTPGALPGLRIPLWWAAYHLVSRQSASRSFPAAPWSR